MKTLFKLIVSVTLLFVVFRDVQFEDVLRSIIQYSPRVLAEVATLQVFALILATFKWRKFLPEYSFGKLFRFIFIGQFYSLILPGQLLGEAAKAYSFARGKEGKSRIAASVVVDKITGLVGLLLVSIFGILFTRTELPGNWRWAVAVAFIIALVSIFLFRFEFVKTFIERHASTLHPVSKFFWAYHKYAEDTKLVVRAVVLGVLFQLSIVWLTFILAESMNIHISPLDWFWIFGVVSVAVLIPITIGGLGVRESIFVSLLGFFAVAPVQALTLSFSIFAIQAITALVGGMLEWRETWSTRKNEPPPV